MDTILSNRNYNRTDEEEKEEQNEKLTILWCFFCLNSLQARSFVLLHCFDEFQVNAGFILH